MESRKIFNFESVILEQLTFEKEGYVPSKFGPTSSKFIWASCRFCGEPARIRKGFFNKSGSACHRPCTLKEMALTSPFKTPEAHVKARETIKKRFGVEFPSQNHDVAKKISDVRSSEENKNKIIKTNIEKYGVKNVFQSEVIKEKIKETSRSKYGTDHPVQSEIVKNKIKETSLNKYGVTNVMLNETISSKSRELQLEARSTDPRYYVTNLLRSEAFWAEISKPGATIHSVCDYFNLPYQHVAGALSRDEFKERFRNVYTYPKCQKQGRVSDFIKSYGLEVICGSREIISPLELDVYVPTKNFAIEFNGSYWHSESVLDPKKARNMHFNKTKKCRELNIRLLHIFENNWDRRSEHYKAYIKSCLGLNETRIGARECSVDHSDAHVFIEQNHLQGKPHKVIKFFNLVFQNEIVASLSVSKHHRQNIEGNPCVLSRLCFKRDVTVQGGASKLFSEMVKWARNENFDRIISWSDNSWTQGGIYKTLDFELTNEYLPDYFYWNIATDSYCSKQSQRKKKTKCPPEMTEREWCFERGLYRIWDCGKKLWTYRL